MKFRTNSIKSCAARIGILTEFERIPNASFETPLALIYTKGGCVPHLTKDVFQMVTSAPQMLSISLPTTISMFESIKDSKLNLAHFIGMKEHINFLSLGDPCYQVPSGFQKPDSIPIWTRNGKRMLNPKKYMEIVEAFEPDIYVALYDEDTDINSSKKRTTKAVQRSKTFFEQCFAIHSESKTLRFSEMIGAITGGYNIDARTDSINYLKDKPLTGFVIDGLHNNGPDVKDISSVEVKELVQHTINLLPVEKLRISMGCWNPFTVLELVQLGVDVFDTTYPYAVTESLKALTFLCDHDVCNNGGHQILLTEERYAEDFSPLCSQCHCLACKNHTKAYIHHLCNTKEMLATVLLMIHNVHHYLEFFNIIRESIKNDTFDECKKRIGLKFKQHNCIPTEESVDTYSIKNE